MPLERCNITSSEQQLSIKTCQNLLRIFSIAYTETRQYNYVAVNKGWTSQLKVKRGVLQGDPLSPLLFNLCFNTLMLKKNNVFCQIEPALYLNSQATPVVAMGDSFTYLGKKFDFELKNKTAKVNIRTKVELLLNITSGLKVKPQTKLKILKQYIHSQMSFELKLYRLGATWTKLNLDALCKKHVSKWMNMPSSACIGEVLTLPKSNGGFNIPSFQNIGEKLWLRKRYALKHSDHDKIRQLWLTKMMLTKASAQTALFRKKDRTSPRPLPVCTDNR